MQQHTGVCTRHSSTPVHSCATCMPFSHLDNCSHNNRFRNFLHQIDGSDSIFHQLSHGRIAGAHFENINCGRESASSARARVLGMHVHFHLIWMKRIPRRLRDAMRLRCDEASVIRTEITTHNTTQQRRTDGRRRRRRRLRIRRQCLAEIYKLYCLSGCA